MYSHEQALHQCSDFLKAHPQLTARPYSNTAASAKLVAEQKDPSLAAIGSVQCARMYGLQLLLPAIQNRSDNFTRFVILAKQPLHHPDCQRISLIGAGAAPRRCPVQRPFPLCGARHQPAQARVPTHPGQPV